LDLYDDEYMAPSVKLLIIKILDQSLFFKSGLLWFTGKILYYKKNENILDFSQVNILIFQQLLMNHLIFG